MAKVGGNRVSGAAQHEAREREHRVIQLVIRGLSYREIGRQLGVNESAVRKAYTRAVKRIPPGEVVELRKLQSERLNDSRRRLFSELAGRTEQVPDPANPGQFKTVTVRPDISEVGILIGRLLNVDQHEAELYGLYAPKKAEVLSAITAQVVSDEELDIWLGRLTAQERETFMLLLAKAQGRWVEPPVTIEDQGTTVETTATMQRSS
jgi:DNA-binding CsgD family transcriptional regulator